MEVKWIAIAIVGVAFAIAIGNFSNKHEPDPAVEIEAVKAGLEQCRLNNMPMAKVIWVKNCKEYVKTFQDD